jgi:hypothetical protein
MQAVTAFPILFAASRVFALHMTDSPQAKDKATTHE